MGVEHMQLTIKNKFHGTTATVTTIRTFTKHVTNKLMHKHNPHIAIIDTEVLSDALFELCATNIGKCACGGQIAVGVNVHGQEFELIPVKHFSEDF